MNTKIIAPHLRRINEHLCTIEQLTMDVRLDPMLAQLPAVLLERQNLLGEIALCIAALNAIDVAWNTRWYADRECAALMQEKKDLVAAIAAADSAIAVMGQRRMDAITTELNTMQKTSHAARQYASSSNVGYARFAS